MGALLQKPVTVKETTQGVWGERRWAACSMQGWRSGMEDAHITIPDLGSLRILPSPLIGELSVEPQGGVKKEEKDLPETHLARIDSKVARTKVAAAASSLNGVGLYAVFDGHGGKEVARYCEARVPQLLIELLQKRLDAHGGGGEPARLAQSWAGELLRDVLHTVDEELTTRRVQRLLWRLKDIVNSASVEEVEGVLMTPSALLSQLMLKKAVDEREEPSAEPVDRQHELRQLLLSIAKGTPAEGEGWVNADKVGCTAVLALVFPDELVVANAGDSRAVACTEGTAHPLSFDHKPNLPEETARIEAANGTVEKCAGARDTPQYRVNGALNLSRAVGDLQYKKGALPPERQIICSTPDIKRMARSSADSFLILACDGVWDVKSNEEVCEFVSARLPKDRTESYRDIVGALLDACLTPSPSETGGLGTDNMTAVLVEL